MWNACLGDLAQSIVLVGLETLPWAARIEQWGSKVKVLGAKKKVKAAVQMLPSTSTKAAISSILKKVGSLLGTELEDSVSWLGFGLSNLFRKHVHCIAACAIDNFLASSL